MLFIAVISYKTLVAQNNFVVNQFHSFMKYYCMWIETCKISTNPFTSPSTGEQGKHVCEEVK